MNGWLTEVKPPYDAKKLEEVKKLPHYKGS